MIISDRLCDLYNYICKHPGHEAGRGRKFVRKKCFDPVYNNHVLVGKYQPLKTGFIYSRLYEDPVILLISHLGVKTLFNKTSRRMMNVFTLQKPTYSHQVGL